MTAKRAPIDDFEYIDPYEVAARATILLSEEDGIPINDALVLFMKSDTFLDLISNRDLQKMEPNEIISLYRSEVSRNV